MADNDGLDENIQPLKIQRDSSPVRGSGSGRRSQICRKAAFSGSSSGEALRQARALMNSDLPNLTVLPTGISKVWVRADSLSMVRSLTMLRSLISRLRWLSPNSSAALSSVGVAASLAGAGVSPWERNSSALSCWSSLCACTAAGRTASRQIISVVTSAVRMKMKTAFLLSSD